MGRVHKAIKVGTAVRRDFESRPAFRTAGSKSNGGERVSGLAAILSPGVMQSVRPEINRAAYRLRRHGYTREDVQQEFALHWVRCGFRVDTHRSSVQTFATCLCRRRAFSLLETATAAKRGGGMIYNFSELPFFDSHGRPVERPENVSQDTHELRLRGRSRAQHEADDLRLDIARVLATLPPRLAVVARGLMFHSPTEVARMLDLSRATVNRRIAEVRDIFAAAGLRKYIQKSATSTGSDARSFPQNSCLRTAEKKGARGK